MANPSTSPGRVANKEPPDADGSDRSATHLHRLSDLLADPEFPDEPLIPKGTALYSPRSGKSYPLRDAGYVDFVNTGPQPAASAATSARGVMDRLNEFYNQRLEQWVAASIFAGGGLNTQRFYRKVREWLRSASGVVVDVGCGDRKAERILPPGCRYIGLDYLPVTELSPWREGYPDINADALALPMRSGAADCVLNLLVLEHVTNPDRLIGEMARILRPGGILLLGGPGDILLTHGEPHMYFNMTRYAYRMLLEKHHMTIEEEFFPARFWSSIAHLVYNHVVRHGWYNGGPARKALQAIMLGLSMIVFPVVNVLALVLDAILPFDQRGYYIYLLRARKI